VVGDNRRDGTRETAIVRPRDGEEVRIEVGEASPNVEFQIGARGQNADEVISTRQEFTACGGPADLLERPSWGTGSRIDDNQGQGTHGSKG
jgi:hypothetical protein